jgi:hypothetical protein
VLHSAIFNGGGSGEPTISDPVNGTWSSYSTTGYFINGDADSEIYLHSFPNCGAGSTQVTCNPPGTSADIDLALTEVSGAVTSSQRDVSVTNTGAFTDQNGYTSSVVTGTLSQADEIIFFSHSHTGDTYAMATDTGDGFTQAAENESNSTGQAYNLGYKIVSSTASVTCNGTKVAGTGAAPRTWFTGVASFKAASAAATSRPARRRPYRFFARR